MRRIALLLSITLVFFAAGCAKAGNQDAAGARQELDVTSEPAAADAGSTTIYGRVDSIVGNEAVLALGEPQQGAKSSDQGSEQTGSEQQSGAAKSQSDTSGTHQRGSWSGNASGGASSGEAPAGAMPSGAPSGEMPAGQMPSDDTSSAQSGSTRQGRSISLTYSGETATYLLPVGMAIGTGDFSDVTVGMVLSLTLDAEGTITAVSILSR